jgi:hypothetical protein
VPFHYPAKRYASDLGFEGAGVDNPR